MSVEDVKRIAHLQMEALQFSLTDKIGSVVQKGIEAGQAMIKNEAIDELELAQTSLHSLIEIVMRKDNNKNDSMRKQIYALCETLEIVLKYRILSSSEVLPITQPNAATAVKSAAAASDNEQDIFPKIEETDQYLIEFEGQLDGQVKQELRDEIGNGTVQEEQLDKVGTNEQRLEDSADHESYVEDSGDSNVPDEDVPTNSNRRRSVAPKRKSASVNANETMEDRKPFKCEICGKGSTSKSHLKRHIATHSKEEVLRRPYKCDICGKRFTQSQWLSSHAKTHSDDLLVRKPFKCKICGNRYAEKKYFMAHVAKHHGAAKESATA